MVNDRILICTWHFKSTIEYKYNSMNNIKGISIEKYAIMR